MNNQAAYINACAHLTSNAFREISMPFCSEPEFTRDFKDGIPEEYLHHLGAMLRRVHEETGYNITCSKLTSEHDSKITIYVKLF